MSNRKKVDVEQLRKDFEYAEAIDPITGVLNGCLLRIQRIGKRGKVGDLCFGRRLKFGYRDMMWRGKAYLSHRLILALVEGRDFGPEEEVNHKDKNRENNLISNLQRVADKTEHFSIDRVGRPTRKNTSGVPNVSWGNKYSKWYVQFKTNGKSKNYGSFKDFDEAVQRRNEVAKQLGAPIYD